MYKLQFCTFIHYIGKVTLSGITGTPITCPLVRLQVHLQSDGTSHSVFATCAVLKDAAEALVLPMALVDHLCSHSFDMPCSDENSGEGCEVHVVTRSGMSTYLTDRPSADCVDQSACTDSEVDEGSYYNPDDSTSHESQMETVNADDLVSGFEGQNSATADAIIDEQKSDPYLQHCWSLLKRGKGNFCLEGGILMRCEKMLGQQVTQLVAPGSKREQILEFSHDLAGHMSPKKSSQRIRMNFWWPTLKQDVTDYIKSCKTCQLQARKTCWDRVPIPPIPRQELPFVHWFFDILGPMSSEKLQYPYCLVMLDSMTRFPMAFAIKAPRAKNICDCLVQVWTLFGNVALLCLRLNFAA